MKQLARLEFEAELVREYSAIPTVDSLGRRKQTMTLYLVSDRAGMIEWIAGEDEDARIGLIFEGRRVVDYDGVFSLPMQAVKLLEAAGYDCSEVILLCHYVANNRAAHMEQQFI